MPRAYSTPGSMTTVRQKRSPALRRGSRQPIFRSLLSVLLARLILLATLLLLARLLLPATLLLTALLLTTLLLTTLLLLARLRVLILIH